MAKQNQRSSGAKNHPEKKFGKYPGGIAVVIWKNQVQTDDGPREIRSITIEPRRYRDKESGQWRDSNSFRASDIPALIHGLSRALDFIYSVPLGREPGDDGDDSHDDGNDNVPY